MIVFGPLLQKFGLDNYAVFPVIFSPSGNHPDKGCLKIISGVNLDGRWNYYSHYNNMQNWDHVFEYYLREIERLEALVNAGTAHERRLIYEQINGNGPVILGVDKFDLLEVTDDGLKSKISITDIAKDSPRWKKEHWLPILAAWEYSMSKLLEFKKTNQLVEL